MAAMSRRIAALTAGSMAALTMIQFRVSSGEPPSHDTARVTPWRRNTSSTCVQAAAIMHAIFIVLFLSTEYAPNLTLSDTKIGPTDIMDARRAAGVPARVRKSRDHNLQ